MDIFQKNKVDNIIDMIVELYNLKKENDEPNARARQMKKEKAFNNWVEVLSGFEEEEIKDVINYFYKNKSSITPPKLSQIKEILNKKNNITFSDVGLKKPICPIEGWQEDFDYIMKKACREGIIFNPYWNNQDEVKSNLKGTWIKNEYGELTTKNYKILWKEILDKAKKNNPIEFERISNYDDIMLDYTLAFRLNYFEDWL